MIYACTMDYTADKARLAAVRPRHRAYMHGLLRDGRVIVAGSFSQEGDGSLYLYDAPSFEEAERMVLDDPFVRENVGTWRLREYEVHGANPGLLRVTG